jgi:hypothetical protein
LEQQQRGEKEKAKVTKKQNNAKMLSKKLFALLFAALLAISFVSAHAGVHLYLPLFLSFLPPTLIIS